MSDILCPFSSLCLKTARNRRLGLLLSQAALADDAGVHRTYITDIEAGHRNLSTFMLLRVAEALRLPLSELIGATEEALCEGGGLPFA